jgi:hypothetical protein
MYVHAHAAVVHSYICLKDVMVKLLQTNRVETEKLNEGHYYSWCYSSFLLVNLRLLHSIALIHDCMIKDITVGVRLGCGDPGGERCGPP